MSKDSIMYTYSLPLPTAPKQPLEPSPQDPRWFQVRGKGEKGYRDGWGGIRGRRGR